MAEKSLEAHFIECLEKGNTKKAKYITQLLGDNVNKLYRGKSPLVWAKEFHNEEVIKALEEKGAREVAVSDEEALRLGKELIETSRYGEVEKVVELIENGADVNLRDDEYGETALMKASYEGYIEVAEKIIENGADVNIKDNEGWTALMYASREGYIGLVENLIKKGADVNVQDNDYYRTALMLASYNKHIEVMEKLIEHGADVNTKNNDGRTALIWASREGNIEVVKKLIEYGADVNIKNSDGKNAIELAKNDDVRTAIFEAIKDKKAESKENKTGFIDKVKGLFGRG